MVTFFSFFKFLIKYIRDQKFYKYSTISTCGLNSSPSFSLWHVGIAAGLGLQAAMEEAPDLCGQVTVLGSPAEEEGGGKLDLIKAGSFAGVDAAIMVHPSNMTIVRPLKLAVNFVIVTYSGKAAHAARSPWDGTNALDAAVAAYSNLSLLRQQSKPTWRLHAVITEGGDEPYIIPERSRIEAYVRAPTLMELSVLKKKAQAVFESAAIATGCDVEISWGSEEAAHYANVVTNPVLADILEEHFTSMGLDDSKSTKIGGSTDMGNVSQLVPSLHPMLDIDTTAKQHTRPFRDASNTDIAHERTLNAAKALAMTGLDLMLRPDLLQKAKTMHYAG